MSLKCGKRSKNDRVSSGLYSRSWSLITRGMLPGINPRTLGRCLFEALEKTAGKTCVSDSQAQNLFLEFAGSVVVASVAYFFKHLNDKVFSAFRIFESICHFCRPHAQFRKRSKISTADATSTGASAPTLFRVARSPQRCQLTNQTLSMYEK